MNIKSNTTGIDSAKVLLSTLWIFLSVNYMYCDFLTNMQSTVLKDLLTGSVAGLQVTQGFLLGSGILVEIPMAMILLSRVLKFGANRWANIIAAGIMSVVQIASLFVGTAPALHYIFFSIVEIAGTLFIVWYAWKWRKSES